MSPQRLARLAGAIYFVQIFVGSFPLYVRSTLIVSDDTTATIANVLASETLFRFGMLSEVAVSLTWLSMAFTLFILLKPVRREVSMAFLILVIVGVATINTNVVHLSSALALIEGGVHASSFDSPELQSLGMVLFSVFNKGEVVWGLFAGLWLIPLGFVVLKSRYVPRVFGVLLMLASTGYVLPIIASYVIPEYASTIRPLIVVSGLTEISFGLWLLVKGVNTPESTQLSEG